MNQNGNQIEARLWAAADELRANSKLKSSEYSIPVLGMIFLRYADHKFQAAARELEGSAQAASRSARPITRHRASSICRRRRVSHP